jgi:hypothetical protein
MGPADHAITQGQSRICCEKVRDKHDRIVVQEILDGSCLAAALKDGILHPLGRAGWPAASSPYEQHRLFDRWVWENEGRFRAVLKEGERLCGEWLAQAHGTRYRLWHEPFVPFDIMVGDRRLLYEEFESRVMEHFTIPCLVSAGPPVPIEKAMEFVIYNNCHCAIDPIEGVVYRCEREGRVDFLAKYVRPDKIDGRYLPEISGHEPIWNWRP